MMKPCPSLDIYDVAVLAIVADQSWFKGPARHPGTLDVSRQRVPWAGEIVAQKERRNTDAILSKLERHGLIASSVQKDVPGPTWAATDVGMRISLRFAWHQNPGHQPKSDMFWWNVAYLIAGMFMGAFVALVMLARL
jgi:hypothetical protein